MIAEKTKESYSGCVEVFVSTSLTVLGRAWAVMMAMGIIHTEFSSNIPAIGFWPAFVLSWAWSMIALPARWDSAKK